MATKGWNGRKQTLTILIQGTTSDVLDLGRMEPDTATATQKMVKGADGGADQILLNGQEIVTVLSIVSVVQGLTTYIATTDYVLGSNKVDWSPGVGAPVMGTEYEVTYTYTKPVGSKSYRRWDLEILGPATLTNTVTLQISDQETTGFVAAQSGGSDIVVAAAKALPVIPLIARYMRLVAGGAEAAERAFVVMGTTIK